MYSEGKAGVDMLKRIILTSAVLTVSLLSVFSTSVKACLCDLTYSGLQPCQEYWSSAAVFTGKVADISIIPIVEWPDGRPAIGAIVGLEFTERRWTGPLKTVDDQGRFSLKCFEGYKYLIHAEHGDNQNWMHAEPVEVLVAG